MNLHKYYYRDYFSEKPESIYDERRHTNHQVSLDWSNIKKEDNIIILEKRNRKLTSPDLLSDIPNSIATDKFSLKVLYPGLITGIGINHEATIEGEFKLGMHFDWTYGMPVVYGSSVKGVLKAYFKEFYDPNPNQPSKENALNDIFKGDGKSIYNRDIFFDAVIVKPSKNRILCSDSITPHGDNPLKNPVPITFLKIAPGCQLEFRFKLVRTEMIHDGKKQVLTQQEKLDIFKEILTTVGIGAKTNVGYGQLK